MVEEKFPFRESTWHSGDAKSQEWLDALEKTGVASVRAKLAQTDASSHGAVAIGTVLSMTIGFAQEWASWKEARKAAADIERHERQIRWTKTAAIAASIAAFSAFAGWTWTIFSKVSW